ncbi:uncharacterized protein LOC106180056 [Lingula anatina]|uniref:Uncharacterized protein LOC106180056 n=1 Tax=Lingula anatina TaxID=7574 RepID=A0A2R2MSL5_LINAN|nr:uncharacterized protein LOC106180056 [Lingula anatina]|eukprot:XP_023933260.1 uncharacterized protein LOC106180056 [Lingula anatina]
MYLNEVKFELKHKMADQSDGMSFKYTVEDVQRLTSITGAMDFCEFHEIDYGDLETMDDIKNLLLFKLKKQTARLPASTMMKKLIDEDIKKRQELSRVYGKLREFMNKVDDKLKLQVETAIPNCIAKITQYNHELVKDECPILVAGETSAGKSSLLNLLLGEEVLPYSLLSTTSTLCQLKNDDRKRAVVHLMEPDPTTGRETIEFDLKKTGDSSIQDQLQEYANSKERGADTYKFIEIFWPIPLLQGNVFIVDSPGVGENEFMNKVVMDYLPKAFAFIYVINSGNAGGVQEGRLEKLLKILTDPKDRDQLQMFDPESAIFVFNKWDQVPPDEEEEVRKKTLEKLMRCWQGLTEKQVFYLSVTEAFRNLRAGAGFTEGYQKLLDGIQELVPKSLQTKLTKHHKWIEFFVGRLTYVIRTKIMNARRTMQEKQEKKEEITKRLDKLQRTSDDVLLKMTNTLDDRIEKIVDGLHQFLSSPSTMERLNEWNTAELPDVKINAFVSSRKSPLFHDRESGFRKQTKNWQES